MTNSLTFAVVVLLTTNKVEILHRPQMAGPCPDGIAGCAVYHAIDVPGSEPHGKTVTISVDRVTNAVHGLWSCELGRARVLSITEQFLPIVERKWERISASTNIDWAWITNGAK